MFLQDGKIAEANFYPEKRKKIHLTSDGVRIFFIHFGVFSFFVFFGRRIEWIFKLSTSTYVQNDNGKPFFLCSTLRIIFLAVLFFFRLLLVLIKALHSTHLSAAVACGIPFMNPPSYCALQIIKKRNKRTKS